MSKVIDKQIKIRMTLNAVQALRSVDSLAKCLEKIAKIPKGNVNEFFNQVANSAKQASNALGQTETANKKAGASFNGLTQQLKKAKQEYEVLYTKFKTGLYPNINLTQINAAAEKVRNLTQSVEAMKSKLKENGWKGSMSGDMVMQTRAEIRGLERQILDAKLAGNKELEKSLLNQYRQKKDMLRIDENMVIKENKILATQREIATLRNKYQNALKANDAQGMSNALAGLQSLGAGNPANYATQLATMRRQAESLFAAMKNGSKEAKAEFDKLMGAAKKLNRESVEFNKVWGITGRGFYDLGHNVDYFFAKMRSHLSWIGSGLVLGSLFAIPASAFESIKKVESHMAGMKQVNEELHHSQKALNKQTLEFLDIAARYGEKVENIIEAGTLWGRAYKDLNMVNALVRQSATLAVADNFSITEANKALEAAMFQYGLVAKNTTEAVAYSSKIIDIWTNVAHNATVSAQDLAHATERAGSVARITGVDFEFLTAMIATGVRATVRSGAEIGNMIKSVLGSFHSDKAVEELEKIGIKVKQVGKDGQLEFRKAQDVLLELALTAEMTDKNVENLFKQISGGKFQWAKAAAMLGDYKQFIHDWGLALNSQGAAARQVEMQLDTISRRLQALSTDMEKLFVSGGNAGITQYLKEQIAALNNFVIGLQKIPGSAVQAITAIAAITLALDKVKTAKNAYTAALATYTAATKAADASTKALAASQMYLAKRNFVILSLMALSYGVYSLLEYLGKLENVERKRIQQAKDSVAAHAQELDVLEQKAKFIDTLITAHEKFKKEIDSGTLSAEKSKIAHENLEATQKQLGGVLGNEAKKRLQENDWSIESINKEKEAFAKSVEEKQKFLKQMREALATDLEARITELEKNIETYYKDAEEFGKSIEKKIKYLGYWKAAQLTYYNWKKDSTQTLLDGVNEKIEKAENSGGFFASLQLRGLKNQKEHYEKNLAEYTDKGKNLVDEKAKEMQKELNDLQQQYLNVTKEINYNPSKPGGDIVDTSDDKKGGSSRGAGSDAPKSLEEKFKRLGINFDVAKMFSDAKIAAKEYETALIAIEGKEQLYGATLSTIDKKYKLISDRINKVTAEKDAFHKKANEYEKDLEEEINKIPELVDYLKEKQTVWANLDRDTKREVLELARGYAAEYETINKTMTTANKLREEAVSKEKELVSLENKKQKNEFTDKINAIKNEISEISQNKELQHLLQGRFETGEQSRLIELQAVTDELKKWLDIKEKLIALGNEEILGSKEFKEAEINIERLKQKELELKDVFAGLKKGFADTLLDMANGQKKFGDFFKGLWKELAKEAIYRIFKIKTATSVLGGIFQAIGGVKIAPAPTPSHNGSVIAAYPKMHSGGDVMNNPVVPYLKSNEVIRTLQVGEEVNSIRERRTTEIMAAVAMKAMSKQEQQQPIVVYAMDAQSVSDFFMRNGELMAAVLRNPKYNR